MGTRLSKFDLYYILGFGFLNFTESGSSILLTKKREHLHTLVDISFKLYNEDRVEKDIRSSAMLAIDDPDIVKFLCAHGVFTPKRYMPMIDEEFAMAFTAGYFDGHGELSVRGDNARITVATPSWVNGMLEFIARQWKVQAHGDRVMANGYKALDLCGTMYKNVSLHDQHRVSQYMDMLNWEAEKKVAKKQKFQFAKLNPKAVAPNKSRVTDSGYDLCVLEMTRLYGNVYKANTFLSVKPLMGYAFDVAGRSSLPDTGWQFLQGVGICDRSYTGGIQATMMKLNPDAPMPSFPWRCLQLVPREAPIHADWEEVKALGESDRGAGGFGSSGL